MPIQPTYPGVYVQEVPSEVRTITGVSTSIALFIGRAVWGEFPDKPVLCLNYSDFERRFTSDASLSDLPRAVKLFFQNGGTQCFVIRVTGTGHTPTKWDLNDLTMIAKYDGTYGNKIHVVISAGLDSTHFNMEIYREEIISPGNTRKKGVESWKDLSMDSSDDRFVEKIVNSQWLRSVEATGNLLPAFVDYADPNPNVTAGADGANPGLDDYNAAFLLADKEIDLFNLLVLPKDRDLAAKDVWDAACVFCGKRRAFLLMDPLDSTTWTDDPVSIPTDLADLRGSLDPKSNSAIYYPNLVVRENGAEVFVGPSGAIAGLMARIDTNRGVWKAPAGVEASIRGIKGLQFRLTDEQNGVLNPLALNVIRVFPNGIVSWGARTNAGADSESNEWKYIPVRRTALFIEESLYRGLKWVVFEPNDERLWGQIRLNVGAFMHNLFRQGAFQGLKKSDAYFVKCDAETTTQNDINLGIVNVWVGFAPLKPAEFVILYLQQMTGQVQI